MDNAINTWEFFLKGNNIGRFEFNQGTDITRENQEILVEKMLKSLESNGNN